MEKEYDEIVYMDLNSFINRKNVYDSATIEAARLYLNKLGFDPEDNTLIHITSIDVDTLAYLILDIISDYQTGNRQTVSFSNSSAKNQTAG